MRRETPLGPDRRRQYRADFLYLYLCICVCVFVFVYLYERETKLRSALPWALMVEANTKPTILERLKPIYKPSLEKLRGEIKQQDRQRWRYV